MKRVFLKGACLFVCAICLINCGCGVYIDLDGPKESFEKYPHLMFVKTQHVGSDKVSYYDLNDHGDYRRCGAFETNAVELYNLEGAIPDKVKKALDLVDDFEAQEKHQLSVDRVFLYQDRCFISVWYNVNWQVPYSLLEYDEESETLREIMYISDAEIVGLKI